ETRAERLLGCRDGPLRTDEEPVRRPMRDPKAVLLEVGDDGLLLPNGGRVMRDELPLREEAVVARRRRVLDVLEEALQGGPAAERERHEHGGRGLGRRGPEIPGSGEAWRERSDPRLSGWASGMSSRARRGEPQ